MALYIPRGIFHLAQLLYVRPETFGPTLVCFVERASLYTLISYTGTKVNKTKSGNAKQAKETHK
jgi:hypothetical protein